ncbi:uncharacterized protein LOC116160916 [Photinus pyralis]|nr:uncharacterized protein LOC116160916 [Photinus pyralis]
MERFDTELFIDEVEKMPAIWDMKSADYSNRIKKNGAWQELVEIFAHGEDTLEKKIIVLGATLQKKWKNIRDAYMKEYKKNTSIPSGSGSQKGTTYIYFSRLSFLQVCAENKETTSNVEEPRNEEQRNEGEEEDFVEPRDIRPVSKKKKTLNSSEERLTDLLERSIQTRDKFQHETVSQDEDKLFCLSLYKELKNVPEQKRLATKIELLQVLQKAQTLPGNTIRLISQSQHSPSNTYTNFWNNQHYSFPLGSSTVTESAQPSPLSQTTSDSSQSKIVEELRFILS